MNSPAVGLRVASVIFGLVSLAQLARLVTGMEVIAAGHRVPLWPSVIAVVAAGGLSVWMGRLARRATRRQS